MELGGWYEIGTWQVNFIGKHSVLGSLVLGEMHDTW